MQTNVLNTHCWKWWNKVTITNNAWETEASQPWVLSDFSTLTHSALCCAGNRHKAIISYSDSLPGNMSDGHWVACPVGTWRQSWSREFCREGRERSQLMSHKLHQGAPPLPPPPPKKPSMPKAHLYTASVRWIGWVTLSRSPERGHTWQTVGGQGAWRKGEQDGGGGGALGYGQALNKRCFNMHTASQQESFKVFWQDTSSLWICGLLGGANYCTL